MSLKALKDGFASFWGGFRTMWGCFGCWALLKGICKPWCPLSKRWALSKKAQADVLDNVATVAVMGIFSLNLYCATYFLAWSPMTVNCLPDLHVSDHLFEAVKKYMKVIVGGLPFILFPMTLYIAGQAKALQRDLRGLGLVAGGVMLEVVYMLCLGAVMTVCTSGSHLIPVSSVTAVLILLLVIAWGCCCHSPKCLRSLLGCLCCWRCACQEVDIEAPAMAVAVELTAEVAMEAATIALDPPPQAQV